MRFKKYHRRYPEAKWDFKAISTFYENKEIIYYTLISNGKKSKGVGIFSGRNYIVNSSSGSYSRRYSISNLPKKYRNIVKQLILIHKKTKWSNKKKVDLN